MIGPKLAAAATTPVEKPSPYCFLSDGTSVEDRAEASATAAPDTEASPAPDTMATLKSSFWPICRPEMPRGCLSMFGADPTRADQRGSVLLALLVMIVA